MIKKLGVVLSLVLIAILVCTAAACAAPSGASSDFSATTSGSIRDNVSFAGDDGDNPGIINFIATFESNGGSPVPAQQTPVVQEEPATTRDGYRFAGWFLTPDFSDSRAVFPYALERNTTFYAKWLSNTTQPVSTVEELIAIGTDEGTLSGNYALVNNIDLSSIEAWTAIGYKEALKFTGTFDGNGYTISNMTVKDLTEDEVSKIREYIDHNLTVEGELKREVKLNIKRLTEIGCYRGIRHRKGLPVRGQNTKQNARTRKGPKKTVSRSKKK